MNRRSCWQPKVSCPVPFSCVLVIQIVPDCSLHFLTFSYIYRFMRCFYPKQFPLQIYIIISVYVCVLPGYQTHDLGGVTTLAVPAELSELLVLPILSIFSVWQWCAKCVSYLHRCIFTISLHTGVLCCLNIYYKFAERNAMLFACFLSPCLFLTLQPCWRSQWLQRCGLPPTHGVVWASQSPCRPKPLRSSAEPTTSHTNPPWALHMRYTKEHNLSVFLSLSFFSLSPSLTRSLFLPSPSHPLSLFLALSLSLLPSPAFFLWLTLSPCRFPSRSLSSLSISCSSFLGFHGGGGRLVLHSASWFWV